MQNKIVVPFLTLLIGLGAGYLWGGSSVPAQVGVHTMPDGTLMRDVEIGMGHAMDEMTSSLKGLSGDAFDKAFLAEMIVHHEGAVSMAESALKDAKHEELKSMAKEIISAQTKEIAQMKAWQKSWYNQ